MGISFLFSLPMAQMVKNLPAVWETWVPSLGQEGNGNLLQYSCLENSLNRGAWPRGFPGRYLPTAAELEGREHRRGWVGMAVLIRDSRITEVSFGWALLLPQTSRSSPWSLSVCLLRNYLLGLYLLALVSRSVYRMQVPGYQSRVHT